MLSKDLLAGNFFAKDNHGTTVLVDSEDLAEPKVDRRVVVLNGAANIIAAGAVSFSSDSDLRCPRRHLKRNSVVKHICHGRIYGTTTK